MSHTPCARQPSKIACPLWSRGSEKAIEGWAAVTNSFSTLPPSSRPPPVFPSEAEGPETFALAPGRLRALRQGARDCRVGRAGIEGPPSPWVPGFPGTTRVGLADERLRSLGFARDDIRTARDEMSEVSDLPFRTVTPSTAARLGEIVLTAQSPRRPKHPDHLELTVSRSAASFRYRPMPETANGSTPGMV